ncbi:hypothetical protein C7M84_009312 [Penaeus vannamei]|uniref:Uncharacterized protein n=1 Tax=Penaeus vannamei TaxID=6689 RepID=A0A423T784_PENVA|nr:hypothetical protein C7M84_009312 [Penaeus vannamei]
MVEDNMNSKRRGRSIPRGESDRHTGNVHSSSLWRLGKRENSGSSGHVQQLLEHWASASPFAEPLRECVDTEKEDAKDADGKAADRDKEQAEKEAVVLKEEKEDAEDAEEDKTNYTVVKEEEATSKSEDEESSDENYPEVVVLSRKKASNRRGPCVRGPGVQSMPSCMMYTGQAIGFDSYDVSANNYNFPPVQQQMCSPGYVTYKSPLHASSPGYQDNCLPDQTDTGYIMDSPLYQPNMSPASSALETFLPSPMSSGSYYQNEMSGASPGYGMNQNCYEFPDTPNSLRDDSEAVQMLPTATRQASDYGQILENQSFVSEPRKDVDIGSILEAIYRVENKPQSSPIPVEDLVEITKNLRSCELAGVPNFSNFGDDLEEILEVAPRLHNVEDIIRLINTARPRPPAHPTTIPSPASRTHPRPSPPPSPPITPSPSLSHPITPSPHSTTPFPLPSPPPSTTPPPLLASPLSPPPFPSPPPHPPLPLPPSLPTPSPLPRLPHAHPPPNTVLTPIRPLARTPVI